MNGVPRDDELGLLSSEAPVERGNLFVEFLAESVHADALEATFAAAQADAETDERRTKFAVVEGSGESERPHQDVSERMTGLEPATLTLAR
jgi:hypothetical protein